MSQKWLRQNTGKSPILQIVLDEANPLNHHLIYRLPKFSILILNGHIFNSLKPTIQIEPKPVLSLKFVL